MPVAPGLPRIATVVLAAGSASRMGLRPKCLLELQGQPLVGRLLQALQQTTAGPVVLVLGHYAAAIAQAVNGLAAQGLVLQTVLNPTPDDGQAASLRLGLAALPRESIDGVMVALADQPLVGPQEIADLLQAFARRPPQTEMVVPRVNGQPGNPVVFSPMVLEALLASDAPLSGREWQKAHPQRVHRWDSTNPNYCTDVDTPQDIEALARLQGLQLRWPQKNMP
jgi:molybdenum cofactor cytidylyltransferase